MNTNVVRFHQMSYLDASDSFRLESGIATEEIVLLLDHVDIGREKEVQWPVMIVPYPSRSVLRSEAIYAGPEVFPLNSNELPSPGLMDIWV